jgi:hypothetical protein
VLSASTAADTGSGTTQPRRATWSQPPRRPAIARDTSLDDRQLVIYRLGDAHRLRLTLATVRAPSPAAHWPPRDDPGAATAGLGRSRGSTDACRVQPTWCTTARGSRADDFAGRRRRYGTGHAHSPTRRRPESDRQWVTRDQLAAVSSHPGRLTPAPVVRVGRQQDRQRAWRATEVRARRWRGAGSARPRPRSAQVQRRRVLRQAEHRQHPQPFRHRGLGHWMPGLQVDHE